MEKDERKAGTSQQTGGNHQHLRTMGPAPGKVTRTSKLPGHAGEAMQRKESASSGAAPPAQGPSMPDPMREYWMDAAHRGLSAVCPDGPAPVQARPGAAPGGGAMDADPASVHEAAASGVAGSGSALPFRDRIQQSFGPAHDLGGVRAHVGSAATRASERIGAQAYATGQDIAFGGQPDLHTAAHEAAHVIQQRAGVALSGGVGQKDDAYEQHADAVANRVVQGGSAQSLLDQMAPARGGGGARRAIQKFESDEHARMGDNGARDGSGAVGQVELAPGYSISHGEMVAMAGDFFASIDQMRSMAARPGPGAGTREEIEYVRAVKIRGVTGGSYSQAARDAVDARYYELAANNRSHFSNATGADTGRSVAEQAGQAPDPERDTIFLGVRVPPSPRNAIEGYRYYHARALASAARAAAEGQSIDAALATEAFGGHFLTDSFSAGHVRTERQSIKEHWDRKIPMFFYNLKGWMAEQIATRVAAGMTLFGRQVRADVAYDPPIGTGARQIIAEKLDAIGPLGFGDLVSGAIHDYDNQHGVVATSAGASVTLYGDGHAGEGDEERLATEAVRTGISEIRQAFANGAAMSAQEIIDTSVGSDGLFAPERMIPEARPDTAQGPEQGTTRWNYAEVEELLADAQFAVGARIFAAEKAAVMREVAAGLDASQVAALENGVVRPLTRDPIGTLRQVINWTPTLSDSSDGHNTDDHSNDYWREARSTSGGLRSLTYAQRERLIGRLLDGAAVGDDEDAIMDVLTNAPDGDARGLIRRYGWETLYDAIDDGPGESFIEAFPRARYE
jgi:Domain of unknown function (DUF4157)